MAWTSLCELIELKPGEGKYVEIDGFQLAVFIENEQVYVIDNTCPHEGGPLGEGELSGEVATCPWHNTEFNVKTGAALGPLTDENVRSFPVKLQGNDVLVDVD